MPALRLQSEPVIHMSSKLAERTRIAVWQLLLAPKRWVLRRRMTKPQTEIVCGHEIIVLPEVFNPVIFRTGRIFAEYLQQYFPNAQNKECMRVLDLGTGSGILAIVAASLGHNVVATDLNPVAIKCARLNAERARLTGSVEVRHGDLFQPVAGEQFDLIVWNPPFFDGEPTSRFDMSWRSTDTIDRFAREASGHLAAQGTVLIIWSSQGAGESLQQQLSAHGLHSESLHRVDLGVEILSVYEIRPHRDLRADSNSNNS